MAFWVHVEKGYTIFIVYFSSFKSLESLESLARLLEKVLKSCETFKIQDFANARLNMLKNDPLIFFFYIFLCKNFFLDIDIFVNYESPLGSPNSHPKKWCCLS